MNSQATSLHQREAESLERDLANIKEGLSLLGIRACSNCGKFFRISNGSETFSVGGEAVCYKCLGSWWPKRAATLDLATRTAFEQKMMRWLIENYEAVVIKDPESSPFAQLAEFRLAVTCHECAGTGLSTKGQCRHCRGNKKIWVVVPSDQF